MKNWFWRIISVILLCWTVNIFYYQSKQLEEPIILDTYIDMPSSEHTSFKLFYLTNKNDVIELDSLQINGYTYSNENSWFPWFGELSAQAYRQEFSHHFLKEASFTLTEEGLGNVNEGVQTNNIFAHFTNGQIIPVKVDKLALTPIEEEVSIFSSPSSFSTNNHVEAVLLKVEEPVSMNPIELPDLVQQHKDLKVMVWKDSKGVSTAFSELANTSWDQLDAPLYTEVTWPLQIEPVDSVALFFHTKESLNEIKFISALQPWTGKTLDGKVVSHDIYIKNEPWLTQEQVNALLEKARGEAK